jgi:hypothetical protein
MICRSSILQHILIRASPQYAANGGISTWANTSAIFLSTNLQSGISFSSGLAFSEELWRHKRPDCIAWRKLRVKPLIEADNARDKLRYKLGDGAAVLLLAARSTSD